MPKGEKNKLTWDEREAIKVLEGTESAYSIAVRYGVSHTAIYKIWKAKGNQKPPIIETNMVAIDTQLIKKMLPSFIEKKIKIVLEEQEIARIKELYKEGA